MKLDIDNYERCLLISLLKDHIDINKKIKPCDAMEKHIISGAIGLSNRVLRKMYVPKSTNVPDENDAGNDKSST